MTEKAVDWVFRDEGDIWRDEEIIHLPEEASFPFPHQKKARSNESRGLVPIERFENRSIILETALERGPYQDEADPLMILFTICQALKNSDFKKISGVVSLKLPANLDRQLVIMIYPSSVNLSEEMKNFLRTRPFVAEFILEDGEKIFCSGDLSPNELYVSPQNHQLFYFDHLRNCSHYAMGAEKTYTFPLIAQKDFDFSLNDPHAIVYLTHLASKAFSALAKAGKKNIKITEISNLFFCTEEEISGDKKLILTLSKQETGFICGIMEIKNSQNEIIARMEFKATSKNNQILNKQNS